MMLFEQRIGGSKPLQVNKKHYIWFSENHITDINKQANKWQHTPFAVTLSSL